MDSLTLQKKHVFLSPHLDDAVFSCGGLIAKAASLGCPVEVVTFYTKEVSPETLPPQQARMVPHGERKREDVAALRVLGAAPIWCDYPERYLRSPWQTSPFQVFRTPTKHVSRAFENSASMGRYLSGLIAESSDAQFFAPLAVGNHFDHVELFLVCLLTAMDQNALSRFTFYEDAYALGTRMRRKHFVTKTACWPWWKAPETRSIRWFLIATMMGALARGRALEDYLPQHGQDLHWSMKPERIDGFESRKLTAISKYETQVRELGGMGMLERLSLHYHRYWGEAEPYWVVSQAAITGSAHKPAEAERDSIQTRGLTFASSRLGNLKE